MKAIVFEAPHQAVKLHDIPTPIPNVDDISVKMIAASLNHRDVWMTKGLYAGLTTGTVLGSCGVGTFNNETVLINPNINWGNNPNYPNHKTYSILGMPVSGTFGEYLITQKDRIVTKPTHLTDIQAAALPLAGLTAYRALFGKAKVTSQDKVLINGIGGGVALMAFQFAVAIGAEVYVTSSSEEKIAKAIEMGAKGGFNYTIPKWGKAFTKKYGGVDVIIDSAGGDGFSELLRVANPLGRIAVYGGTRGISKLSPQNLFWKELQIFGSTMGNDQEFVDMIELVGRHEIIPVVDSVYELEDAPKAFDRMEAGQQFGKIVLKIAND